jgi:hypothetical protein
MRLVNEAIIHASATKPNWMPNKSNVSKQAEIKRWHVEDNGWSDIGYNWCIWRDGELTIGRDRDNDGDTWEEIGAHTKGRNSKSLGIMLEGGYGAVANGAFSDNFTPEQEVTLLALLGTIDGELGDIKISGHNDYANKACPGFNVGDWLAGKEPKPDRTSVTQSKTLQASTVTKVVAIATPVVAAAGDMPIKNLLVLVLFAAIILFATGVIDIERIKKWNRGDK